MTTPDRKTHLLLGQNRSEQQMLESYDLFEELLTKKPKVAAQLASEPQHKARELAESLKPQKGTSHG